MAATVTARAPEQNCLLAALPASEYERIAPMLEFVCLEPRQILALPDEPISRVYFLRSAVVSLLVPMEDGSAVEGATVGRDGAIGLEVFLGDRRTFPLTHEVLASMLGVRRASITEAATSLQDGGLIHYHRGSMTIVDAERLTAAACVDYQLSRVAHGGCESLCGTEHA